MKLHRIQESLLQFGRGTDICPRSGITHLDVYDTLIPARREKIHVGAVGTSACLEKLDKRLALYTSPIVTTSSNDRLHPSFCGFNQKLGFKAEFIYVDNITKRLDNSNIKEIKRIKNRNERVNAAIDLYYRHVEFLVRHRNVDVIVCIIPTEIYDLISREEDQPIEEQIDDDQIDDELELNFRRALKARTMHLGRPIQLSREITLESNVRTQQDDATKAWNFCTALYYKANKTVPWKLVINPDRPSICFAGIGFYRSRDRKSLHTSLAQVFDELGNGVILRGTPIEVSRKDDRIPHLSEKQAYILLKRAISEYEMALNTSPGRLVLHKSSNYTDDELDGFRQATKEMRVKTVDFVTILDSNIRLLRNGIYPPYRGTHIELDNENHVLYTRGSVERYGTYPGKYIPQPLEVRIVEADESPSVICSEILGLTKMNWNNTQFDRKYPITIECARKVGLIMKYVPEHEDPQISYSYYM